MTDDAQQYRAAYRPSGKVDWLEFLPGLLVTAGTALVMAWCLYWAFRRGFYVILLAPVIASLPVVGFWYLVLMWSHCRNKSVATATSFALALVLYLGYYHAGLMQFIGVQNAQRIDLLPFYVQFRMMTDVAQPAGHPAPRNAPPRLPNRLQQGFNWFFFGLELLTVIGLFAMVGRHCTSKAYCEPCARWMKSETLKLPTGAGAAVWEALKEGRFSDVAARLTNVSRQGAIHCALTVEHCPACAAEETPPTVYLSVKDVPAPGARDPIGAKVASLLKPRPSAGLRTLVDHVALNPDEVDAIAASFPGLRSTMAAPPKLFPTSEPAVRETRRQPGPVVDQANRRLARITAVEPEDAGQVLTRRNAIVQTIIGVASVFGGFVLAFGPAGVLAGLDPKPPDWALGIATGWLLLCLVLNTLWVLFFPTYFTSRFMLRKTRQAFEYRPNPAVDWHSQDVFFVDIVPRINWGKAMMENASDIGFLELNKAKGVLIFEGDRERYWVPAESILEIKHEFWAESVQHQLQSSPTLHHLVVIRAMTAGGPWETWFWRRHNEFRPRTAKRRLADAKELEARIRELVGTTAGEGFGPAPSLDA